MPANFSEFYNGSFADVIAQIVIPVVVTLTTVYALRWRERKAQGFRRGEKLRKAYASWFAEESLLFQDAIATCNSVVGFPKNQSSLDSVSRLVDQLSKRIHTLVRVAEDIQLEERTEWLRSAIDVVTGEWGWVARKLVFVSKHHRENVNLHQGTTELMKEYAKQDESGRLLLSVRDAPSIQRQFLDHDESCYFKSDDFHDDMVGAIEKIHSLASKVRDRLRSAGVFVRV